MSFDGTLVANLTYELNREILNSRISKIAQPENDELLFTLKSKEGAKRLAISANASLPFLYLTDKNKPSPMTAPNFCMVLRKHIGNGKIIKIEQPSLERIIIFTIEHLDEMGDLKHKKLIAELMGKHSNIIFANEDDTIIDSIKHVGSNMSSVREVLPGRKYFIPETVKKFNPLNTNEEEFLIALSKPETCAKAMYLSYTGISPEAANEISNRSSIDADMPAASLSSDEKHHLYNNFTWFTDDLKEGKFNPNIVYDNDAPIAFVSYKSSVYENKRCVEFDTISQVLENYYAERNIYNRIHQKSSDLRHIITTTLERDRKKLALQNKQLKDTDKREKYKIYGEMLHTYGYSANPGDKSITVLNYYTNEEMTIPLDDTLSASENAKKYFERYTKLKRTKEAMTELVKTTSDEILHLESILTSLDLARDTDDLAQIQEELIEYGFMKRKRGAKKTKIKSKPMHFISSDGYDIYVGKNNYQNDELTFKLATGNDWWFHAKGMPGSHVIVKANNEELPDRAFEEAGMLAGYFSAGKNSDKLEIDYLQKKNVKKPGGAAPGFVVYYSNYSLIAHPGLGDLKQIDD
ncbi:MAG: NFACT family protein [Lachnospiraceae bacterium]|nr:NFACT family protein [Lachnospiraceae bacterium]